MYRYTFTAWISPDNTVDFDVTADNEEAAARAALAMRPDLAGFSWSVAFAGSAA